MNGSSLCRKADNEYYVTCTCLGSVAEAGNEKGSWQANLVSGLHHVLLPLPNKGAHKSEISLLEHCGLLSGVAA